MASAVYDHIIAILVVGVIFVATVVTLPAINYSNLQTVDQQQLRNTAINVFDSMLLGVGSPSDWGSKLPFDQNNVALFGLASSSALSKFVLDPDKVQRLDQNPFNPGVIEYDRVRALLNIEGYGFQLSIYRPFRANWSLGITNTVVSFSVTVTRTEDGTPIPNAEVRVTTMVTASKSPKHNEENLIVQRYDPMIYHTNATGSCEGSLNTDLGDFNIDYAVAIMQITVGGLSTTVIAQNDNPMTNLIKTYTFGDTITLSFPDSLNDTKSRRVIKEIAAYDFETLIPIFSAEGPKPKITWGEGYEYWSWTFPGLRTVNPTVLLFAVRLTLQHIGDTIVLIAGPFSFGDSEKIFSFGPDPAASENIIAIMRRLAVISDMTYVVQIAFWKD